MLHEREFQAMNPKSYKLMVITLRYTRSHTEFHNISVETPIPLNAPGPFSEVSTEGIQFQSRSM